MSSVQERGPNAIHITVLALTDQEHYGHTVSAREANQLRRDLNAWHRARKRIEGPYTICSTTDYWHVLDVRGHPVRAFPDRSDAPKKARKYATKLNRKHAREAANADVR